MARRVVSGPVVVGRMRADAGRTVALPFAVGSADAVGTRACGPRVMWPMHGVDSQGWETVVGDHHQTAVAAARGRDSPRSTVIQARRRTTRDACSGIRARCVRELAVLTARRSRDGDGDGLGSSLRAGRPPGERPPDVACTVQPRRRLAAGCGLPRASRRGSGVGWQGRTLCPSWCAGQGRACGMLDANGSP